MIATHLRKQSALILSLLCLASTMVCTRVHAEDRVTLKDGRVYIGTILEDDDGELIIKTKVAGIPTEMALRSIEIDLIERDIDLTEEEPEVMPPPVPGLTPTPEAPSEAEPDESTRSFVRPTRYMYIPIQGTIGIRDLDDSTTPITAEGIEAALNKAKRQNLEHIVFHVDSSGGYIKEGERIIEALDKYKGDFTYYALVDRSISAAMAITLSCDQIYVTPNGVLGGALSYSRNATTGDTRVDAKMNSIWSANLTSVAEQRGHHADIVRAMVLPEMTIFTWTTEDGRVITDLEPQVSRPDLWVVDDSDRSVLTLSAAEALKLGFATASVESAADLGERLDIPQWKQHGRYGEAELKKPAERFIKDERKRRDLVGKVEADYNSFVKGGSIVNSAVSHADSIHPSRYEYAYHRDTGAYTTASMQLWRRRTNQAVAAWNTVLGHVSDMKKLTDRMKKNARASQKIERYWAFDESADADEARLEALYDEVVAQNAKLRTIADSASREIRSLEAGRNKTGI